MKVIVEMLRWDSDPQPKLLHVLTHESHSLESVRATVQAVIDDPDNAANAYRIISDNGDELQCSMARNSHAAQLLAAHRE
jgi:hypothetical protein